MLLPPASASRSEAPCPPTPIPAMLIRSLGGVCPLAATTWRGTRVKPATAVAAVERNRRRVNAGWFFITRIHEAETDCAGWRGLGEYEFGGCSPAWPSVRTGPGAPGPQ